MNKMNQLQWKLLTTLDKNAFKVKINFAEIHRSKCPYIETANVIKWKEKHSDFLLSKVP